MKQAALFRRISIAAALSSLVSGTAHAGLPWEGPLTQLQTSLTGPVAKALGVIALAVCGGMLAFGGELSDFTKRVLMVVMALSVMLLASNFMSMFGG
jgi:type IV secretion system protein VirB2